MDKYGVKSILMKMRLVCIIFMATMTVSCMNKTLDVVIAFQNSFKIDLKGKRFMVFYQNKPHEEIRFELSQAEEQKIKEQCLDLISGFNEKEIIINDSCISFPKLYTIISLKLGNKERKISIQMACEKYPPNSDIGMIIRIKDFVNFASKVVNSKPGVKEIPQSDIIYY